MEKRKEFWRALPFVMALLLLTLVPAQSASALFGKGKEEAKAVDGAPVAENMEIKVYRGVAYEGEFRAVDNEGDEMTFAIAQEPKKGMVALTEDGLGLSTRRAASWGRTASPTRRSTPTATSSLPATVSITIEKANSGVCYADMGGSRAHTAAVDLAEHGVFVGAKIGDSYFFEPERTLSRGEFVAMALAAMDVSAEDVQMTGFCDDASIPTWAKGYAVSRAECGRCAPASARPEGVPFARMTPYAPMRPAVVLNRLLRVTDVDLSDYDVQDADNAWCAQAVANLQSVSVIESGRFSTDEMRSGVTRAQAAEILSAAMTLKDGRAGKGGLLSGIFG